VEERAELMGRLDYDTTEIPQNYDRGRDHGPENLRLWMNVVSSFVEPEHVASILDLGCGTGRFSEALAVHFNASVFALDPSQKMLAQAREKQHDPRVRYQLGCAEEIPLPDGEVDLVFMSMSFHHFERPLVAARECHRVLRSGGTAILRAGSRDRIPSYPYVSFFPASLPFLKEHLPTTETMRNTFESAGFQTIAVELVPQEIAPSFRAYAEKLASGSDSILVRLKPEDFDAGIAAMRSCEIQDPVTEPIDVLVFRT
jgi:ubiquinone/menaquinone biosynthesis C-methylase UbiE